MSEPLMVKWICRDLSNGGGSKYLWVFDTRALARKMRAEHVADERLSRLGPPQRTTDIWLARRYREVAMSRGHYLGTYWRRKPAEKEID